MSSTILQDRVAIVTGAGAGLGRSHALELARQGARVVVNDLTGLAQTVVDDINRSGGTAIANTADVTCYDEMQAMAADTIARYGRIDILVNNAGILRDRTFAKMPLDDFRRVMDVHVMGTVNATKAVWAQMQLQAYGRIVMTTSSSGLYGNFGQSNYAAAKMAVVGLMQTLSLEGARHNVRVNCLAPTAVTAMTEGLISQEAAAILVPERVSEGLVFLLSDDAPTRMILLSGGGSFECAHITMTQGIHVDETDETVMQLRKQRAAIEDATNQLIPVSGWDQSKLELHKAMLKGTEK